MIERSRDYLHVRLLMTQPEIYRHSADDYHPDPEKWRPIESDFVVYLVARDAAGLFGFGAFVPRTWSCYEAHLGFLRRSFGSQALDSYRSMLAWMWQNKPRAARIVGEIDVANRRAIAFAKRAGFSEYGLNPRSWFKGGTLRDRVCLGISRP